MKTIIEMVILFLCFFAMFWLGVSTERQSPTPAMGEFSSSGCGANFSSLNQISPHPVYHTIKEMQIWCGAEPDGYWGPETDRKYRAKIALQNRDKVALELWPE